MLMWQIETVWANTRGLEYGVIMLELIKRVLELVEGVCVMNILSYYVTKFGKNHAGCVSSLKVRDPPEQVNKPVYRISV